jgi:hypothetical protein
MHVHTNTLDVGDLADILRATGLAARGVYLDDERGGPNGATSHRSRSHARRLTFYLVATPGYGRRWANSGHKGAGTDKAATYDEWGVFLAELFTRDPDAKAGHYVGAEGFQASNEYPSRGSGRTIGEWQALELPAYDGKVPA